MPHEQTEFEPGHVFGERYVLRRTLGAGAMGQVWIAVDTTLDRQVALKLPLPAKSSGTDSGFWTEARSLARISHPNVVKVFDVAGVAGQPYMAMELIEGFGLDTRVTAKGALDYAESVALCSQIAAALAAAHGVGLVHRDLKPANVLVRKDRDHSLQAILVDFGLAAHRKTSGRAGSPPYMAPEVISAGQSSVASDVYSLAVLMFELLSGRSPFYAPTLDKILQAHLSETRPTLGKHPRGEAWPQGLQEVLHWGMALQPQDRPVGPIEFVAEVRACLEHLLTGSDELSGCIACGMSPIDPTRPCPRCASPQPIRTCPSCGTRQQGLGLNCVRCQHSLMSATQPALGFGKARQFDAVVLCAAYPTGSPANYQRLMKVSAVWGQVGVNLLGLLGDSVFAWVPAQKLADAAKRGWHLLSMASNAASDDGSAEQICMSLTSGVIHLRGSGVAWGRPYIAGPGITGAFAGISQARTHAAGLFVEPRLQTFLDGLLPQDVTLASEPFGIRSRAKGATCHGRNGILRDLIRATEDRLAPPVLIGGVAGVGRSRLLLELFHAMQAQQVTSERRFVWVSCPPSTMAFEGTPIVELVSGILGLPPTEPIAHARHRLSNYCSPEQVEILTDSAARGWFGDARWELVSALRALVTAELENCQAIVFIDDLHDASPDAYELLQDLVSACHESIRMVATARGSAGAIRSALSGWRHVELRPLDDEHVRAWVTEVRGYLDEQLESAMQALRACMGLPTLITAALTKLDQLLIAAKHTQDFDTEQLVASITLADPAEARHLRALAITGPGAPLELLSHLLGPALSESILERLLESGFVSATTGKTPTYSLTLTTAEAVLANPQDASVVADHERCAGWWLDNAQVSDANVGQRLARHMELHGDNHKAAQYSLDIAKQLHNSGGLGQATRLYAAAMHLAADDVDVAQGGMLAQALYVESAYGLAMTAGRVGRPHWVVDATDRLMSMPMLGHELSHSFMLARANALRDLGRHQACLDLLKIQLEKTELPALKEELASHLALNLYVSGDDEGAQSLAQHFADEAEQDPLLCQMLQRTQQMTDTGQWQVSVDSDEFDEFSALSVGRSVSLSRLYGCLGHIALKQGEVDAAVLTYRKAAVLAGYSEDPSIALMVRITLANVLQRTGAHSDALEAFVQIIEDARSRGALRAEWTAMVNCGHSALEDGQMDRAIDILERVVAATQVRDLVRVRDAAVVLLEQAYRATGDHARLRAILASRHDHHKFEGADSGITHSATVNASDFEHVSGADVMVIFDPHERASMFETLDSH